MNATKDWNEHGIANLMKGTDIDNNGMDINVDEDVQKEVSETVQMAGKLGIDLNDFQSHIINGVNGEKQSNQLQ